MEEFLPLVTKCERRLSSISAFLTQAGRLELTNAVLSALPTFYLCTLTLPDSIIKQIDKFRKHCLWRGADLSSKNPSKAAWELVCVPKQNEALMLKILDKFFNKRDTPWVSMIWEKHYSNGRLPNHTKNGSFWWRQNLKLLTSFKTSATVQLQSGNTCSFWQDNWLQQPMQDQYPELYSFARNKNITVCNFYTHDPISMAFNLPLSAEAFTQLNDVQFATQYLPLINSQDKWTLLGL